jgi:hypothetical protein
MNQADRNSRQGGMDMAKVVSITVNRKTSDRQERNGLTVFQKIKRSFAWKFQKKHLPRKKICFVIPDIDLSEEAEEGKEIKHDEIDG